MSPHPEPAVTPDIVAKHPLRAGERTSRPRGISATKAIRVALLKSTYLEVVSLDRDSEIRSVKAAIDLGVDYLLGGTHVQDVLPLLEGTPIRYYPFPGRVVGHPSILEGSEVEIVKSAVALAGHPGVAGLDLLAYRSVGNVPSLMEAVCRAVPKPAIVAGSVDRPDQIEIIRRSGAAGFAVGTSALDGRFPAESTTLDSQLRAISACSTGQLETAGAVARS